MPTFSSFSDTNTSMDFDGLSGLSSSLLDDVDDFQSNSRSKGCLRTAGPYPSLNGLGIHYLFDQSFPKYPDLSDRDLDFAVSFGPSSSSSSERNGYSIESDPSKIEDDVFDYVRETFEDEGLHCGTNTPCLIYPDFGSPTKVSSCEKSEPSLSAGELSRTFLEGTFSLKNPSGSILDAMDTLTPSMVAPFPDINMFNMAYLNRSPEASIDPARIMIQPTCSPHQKAVMDGTSASAPSNVAPSLETADPMPNEGLMNDILSVLSDAISPNNSTINPPTQSVASLPTPPLRSHSTCDRTSRPRVPFLNDAPFDYKVATPTPAPHRSPLADLRCPTNRQNTTLPQVSGLSTSGSPPESPVLNAHLGIELSDLLKRAERYRARYPGREIDKKWLLSYAGKLTERGELLEDYRCYIKGCTQVNRRRDHILVHVGSHVDQRPFACAVCSMRFLRKNECKRHEASHSGHRPYVCEACPEDADKAFVRQDLLKRHLKRAHGIDTGDSRPRPSKKARSD